MSEGVAVYPYDDCLVAERRAAKLVRRHRGVLLLTKTRLRIATFAELSRRCEVLASWIRLKHVRVFFTDATYYGDDRKGTSAMLLPMPRVRVAVKVGVVMDLPGPAPGNGNTQVVYDVQVNVKDLPPVDVTLCRLAQGAADEYERKLMDF